MFLRHFSKLPTAFRMRWLLYTSLLLVTGAAKWLFAHEGHAPLPTKGAQVDVDKGRIVLASSSRSGLDVQVAQVEMRPFGESVLGYVTLVAPWQSHAYATSRLPGKIVKMHARPGEYVKKGQLLAEVQSPQLENLRLELSAAQTKLALSRKTMDLLKLNPASVSGQAIQEAETRYQQDQNALEIAQSKWLSLGLPRSELEMLRKDGSAAKPISLPVQSPIDGLVIHADLTVGRVIEPWEHLFEIVDLREIWVRIDVLEKDLRKVALGQEVELSLSAYPGESFLATIQTQGQALDPWTHLASYWGQLSNPPGKAPRFLPGMKGQAFVRVDQRKNAKVIPANALIEDGLDHYVLVEEASSANASEFQKKSVAVIRRDMDWVEIQSSDVFPGDRVVTRGAHELGSFFVPGILRLTPQAERTIGLQVAPVGQQVVEEVVEMDGAVEVPPDRRSYASPQLEGTLQKIHVDRGQAVAKGQLLGEVASLEFQSLQLELLKEHLEYKLLEKQYEALRELDQVVSRLRLIQVESNLAATRNRWETLWNRLSLLGMSKDQLGALIERKELTELLPVRATVAGTLVHFDKVLGQAVKADEKLFTLHDLEKPWIEGFVSERELSGIQLDQTVRVRFSSDPVGVFAGKVVRSGGVLGTDSRTLSVWIELDDYPQYPLLHKQLARVSVAVGRSGPTLAVPLTALALEGTSSFVFVKKSDGAFDRQEVKMGRSDDRFVEILHGLQAGQVVAVQGTAHLQTAHASIR